MSLPNDAFSLGGKHYIIYLVIYADNYFASVKLISGL